ncbi:tudor and KH domain-containing protein homolog [Periplaneta americana]|uniref:tudor and KH domain-containing protein homolog n=1 Tax=Periplaneta americana TaxID=6978 RepID=UPI0037E79DF6
MSAKYSLPIIIGLTVTGLSTAAYLLYLLLRKDEDDYDTHVQRIKTSRPTAIEVKIPKECVGIVIGRGGITIKDIQEKTDTRIHFKDELETDQHRVCIIRGTPEGAQLAESLIHDIMLNQPLIETLEMFVPQQACGRIIGRNGENIRSVSRASNAKIIIEGGNSSARDMVTTRRVIIKGTSDQIELAKALIEEKVAEDVEMRGRIHESLEKRSPRKKTNQQFLMSAEAVEDEQAKKHNTERLIATGKDGFLEVYVSAVEHPGRFWVQVIGPRAVELDHLVEEMTEFYRQEENREFHAIKEMTVDQLVAAPFSHDDKWYRARVTEVTVDDYDVEESEVALYYLDYGDSDTRRKKEVCSLRPDFLKLRYQAIECSLAKVKPGGAVWTDEAVDLFEDLCHVAQWRVLMSRVDSYKERERGEREGSPIPSVELYDTSGAQDICVAEELVKQGYAAWEKSPEEVQKASGVKQPKEKSAEQGSTGTVPKSNTVTGATTDSNTHPVPLDPQGGGDSKTRRIPAEEVCDSEDDGLEMG